MKLGKETANFTNWLMSAHSELPQVGKGATILMWTDRNAYEVLDVSKDKKTVTIQRYKRKLDKNAEPYSDNYIYDELEGKPFKIYFKWGSWKEKDNYGKYIKINIIFGIKDEYYDWSF